VSDEVLAAGGVVVRGAPRARETLLIHRPRYDDWTHPKGKLDPGESFQDGAGREVREETGWGCERGPELPPIGYTDALGRPKRVRYWVMHPVRDHGFVPGEEVDEIRWVSTDEARVLLSYPRDLETLDATLALDEPIYVVRHAKAGSRLDWRGGDDRRPITFKGERQASRLLEHLGMASVHRVVSSPSMRCVQTVRPMADALSVPLEEHEALREEADPATVLAFATGLSGPSVLCTHGNIVQSLVFTAALIRPLTGSYGWKKGSTWILERNAGRPVGACYLPPPRDRAE
jgi:phosphohistidine phosphatase SixA/8-oxo-dGTP pyrophosphatase MutT (NUDIX family)